LGVSGDMANRDETIQRLLDAGSAREALLADYSGATPRCGICRSRCRLADGRTGRCGTVTNWNGRLYTLIYGHISSAAPDPIEKKPVYHFKPGSRCFSVGSIGCNFKCSFCQNAEIAEAEPLAGIGRSVRFTAPQDLIQAALASQCTGIAWTYNEPAIWLNYTLDCAIAARESGLYTVYVTNGYATLEHIDLIGPYLDVYRVDIKSMDDSFYREFVGIPAIAGVLESASRAKNRWGIHVECVTNIIPGWNDSADNIERTARWICSELGPTTPWHVTRFFPHNRLNNVPPTPLTTLENAAQTARDAGLKFVYLGNVQSHGGSDTRCPKCGKVAVRRDGYNATVTPLVTADGRCADDGENLEIRV